MTHPRWNPIAVVLVAGIAACFTRPGAPQLGDGDGGIDAKSGSGTDAGDARGSGPCLQEQFADTLAGCGSWGELSVSGSGSGSAGHNGDELVLSGGGSGGVQLTCASTSTWPFANGFEVEVTSLPADTSSYAGLIATIQSQDFGALLYSNGGLYAVASGSKMGGVQVSAPVVIGIAPDVQPGSFRLYHVKNGAPVDDGPFPTGLAGPLDGESASFRLDASIALSGAVTWDNLGTCPVR
jgi:hypothetical protein